MTSDDGIYHSIRHDKGPQTCNVILKNALCSAKNVSAREGPGSNLPDVAPEGIKAHVYRRFREAAKDFPNEADPVLEMISGLYKARSESDKGESKDIIGKLFAYLLGLARRPKSSIQSTINYALNPPGGLPFGACESVFDLVFNGRRNLGYYDWRRRGQSNGTLKMTNSTTTF